MTRCRTGVLVLCSVLLTGCGRTEADSIFGRGGTTLWINVPGGRLKAEVYSTPTVSARPVLVLVLHGDLFNPTPSYQYAFAQALTQGFDAPAMPDQVRARLGTPPHVDDVVAAGLLRPGYTDNAGDRSDGERSDARGDNFTADVVDAVATAAQTLKERYMARSVVMVGHSGGATIAAIVLGRHPEVADAALLVACGCGATRSLQPLDFVSGIRPSSTVRLLVGEQDPPRHPRHSYLLSFHRIDSPRQSWVVSSCKGSSDTLVASRIMRRVIGFGLEALIALVLNSSSAHADTISLVGDVDCFGLGGSCPDGSLFRDELGGLFFANNQGPGDPLFTDSWTTPTAVSYNHTYVLSPSISATLETRIAGIHDVNLLVAYNVLFNGTALGPIAANASDDGFQEVLTYLFSVPVNLLTGNDVVSYSGLNGDDGFIVDYSRLRLSDEVLPDTAPVPEPTSLVLLGSGLAAVVTKIRRRRRSS